MVDGSNSRPYSLEKKEELNVPIQSIMIDPHYSAGFYAELWGYSESTVVRWFQDEPGVLKAGGEKRNGRGRVELRIPLSVAMRVYSERTK